MAGTVRNQGIRRPLVKNNIPLPPCFLKTLILKDFKLFRISIYISVDSKKFAESLLMGKYSGFADEFVASNNSIGGRWVRRTKGLEKRRF